MSAKAAARRHLWTHILLSILLSSHLSVSVSYTHTFYLFPLYSFIDHMHFFFLFFLYFRCYFLLKFPCILLPNLFFSFFLTKTNHHQVGHWFEHDIMFSCSMDPSLIPYTSWMFIISRLTASIFRSFCTHVLFLGNLTAWV